MEIQLTVNSVDSVGGTLAPSWGALKTVLMSGLRKPVFQVLQ